MASVLLVIDVQRELVDQLDPSRRAEFLATLQGLLERARRAGNPVVYVRHGDDGLPPGSAGWEIAADVAPAAGEPIVDKRYSDAFRETNLADVLTGLHAERVIICGMQTEFCIDATLREAERRGYAVTLAADGHATYPDGEFSEAQIRALVHRVARERIAIVPAAELFAVPV